MHLLQSLVLLAVVSTMTVLIDAHPVGGHGNENRRGRSNTTDQYKLDQEESRQEHMLGNPNALQTPHMPRVHPFLQEHHLDTYLKEGSSDSPSLDEINSSINNMSDLPQAQHNLNAYLEQSDDLPSMDEFSSSVEHLNELDNTTSPPVSPKTTKPKLKTKTKQKKQI